MLFRMLCSILPVPRMFALPADAAMGASEVHGYSHGDPGLVRSPVSLEDLELLKKTVLFDAEDVRYLRMAAEVLVPRSSEILDVWYGFVGANPHLLHYFCDTRSGRPDAEYLARVRARFARWIKDTTDAKYDQAWLDYQHEVGLRHTRLRKNKTDQVTTPEHIHFRYLLAFIVPISATIEPFLRAGRHLEEDVRGMHAAWTKALVLHTILWSYPYVKEGDF